MATDIDALKEELAQAQADLRMRSYVYWRGDVNAGMIDYGTALNRCHQLQLRIQRAEEAGK